MTRQYLQSSNDPWIEKSVRDETPLYKYVPTPEIDESAGSNTELIEHVERMVNKTGELILEVQEKPIMYNAQIHDLGRLDEYELIIPLTILIEEYTAEDTVIASFSEIEEIGEGVTVSEAIYNLKLAIVDLYENLTETPPEELGNLPKSWLKILKRVIRKV
jgi:hypothetical protein